MFYCFKQALFTVFTRKHEDRNLLDNNLTSQATIPNNFNSTVCNGFIIKAETEYPNITSSNFYHRDLHLVNFKLSYLKQGFQSSFLPQLSRKSLNTENKLSSTAYVLWELYEALAQEHWVSISTPCNDNFVENSSQAKLDKFRWPYNMTNGEIPKLCCHCSMFFRCALSNVARKYPALVPEVNWRIFIFNFGFLHLSLSEWQRVNAWKLGNWISLWWSICAIEKNNSI